MYVLPVAQNQQEMWPAAAWLYLNAGFLGKHIIRDWTFLVSALKGPACSPPLLRYWHGPVPLHQLLDATTHPPSQETVLQFPPTLVEGFHHIL